MHFYDNGASSSARKQYSATGNCAFLIRTRQKRFTQPVTCLKPTVFDWWADSALWLYFIWKCVSQDINLSSWVQVSSKVTSPCNAWPCLPRSGLVILSFLLSSAKQSLILTLKSLIKNELKKHWFRNSTNLNISKNTYASIDSVTLPIWLTFSRRQLHAFFSTAIMIRFGFVTVRSSLKNFHLILNKIRWKNEKPQNSWVHG